MAKWSNVKKDPPPLWEPVMFKDTNIVGLPSSWAQLYGMYIGRRGEVRLDDKKTLSYYELNGFAMRAVDIPPGLEWTPLPI